MHPQFTTHPMEMSRNEDVTMVHVDFTWHAVTRNGTLKTILYGEVMLILVKACYQAGTAGNTHDNYQFTSHKKEHGAFALGRWMSLLTLMCHTSLVRRTILREVVDFSSMCVYLLCEYAVQGPDRLRPLDRVQPACLIYSGSSSR